MARVTVRCDICHSGMTYVTRGGVTGGTPPMVSVTPVTVLGVEGTTHPPPHCVIALFWYDRDMPAHQHINQEQLRALKALDFPTDDEGGYYTVGQLDPELSFADIEHYNTLKADIAKRGILKPLQVRKGQIDDGHHRAVAAKELGLPRIPVIEEE